MKMPEIVVHVGNNGTLWLETEDGTVDCPWRATYCGSWCPHFEAVDEGLFPGNGLRYARVRLFCTPRERDLISLRVVEPENKESKEDTP